MAGNFFDTFSEKLFRGRDWALGEMGRLLAGRLDLARYGELTGLSVDARAKEVRAFLLLRGENSPVEVRADYRLVSGDGGDFLVFDRVRFSREWMTRFFEEFVGEDFRRVRLTAGAALAAKILGR